MYLLTKSYCTKSIMILYIYYYTTYAMRLLGYCPHQLATTTNSPDSCHIRNPFYCQTELNRRNQTLMWWKMRNVITFTGLKFHLRKHFPEYLYIFLSSYSWKKAQWCRNVEVWDIKHWDLMSVTSEKSSGKCPSKPSLVLSSQCLELPFQIHWCSERPCSVQTLKKFVIK